MSDAPETAASTAAEEVAAASAVVAAPEVVAATEVAAPEVPAPVAAEAELEPGTPPSEAAPLPPTALPEAIAAAEASAPLPPPVAAAEASAPPPPPVAAEPVLLPKPAYEAPLSSGDDAAAGSSGSSSSSSSALSSSGAIDASGEDSGTPVNLGEVHYETVSMSAAKARFSSTNVGPTTVSTLSPRRAGTWTSKAAEGGGASEGAAAAAAAPAPVTVYHKGVWHPLADLVAATSKAPGAFEGIDFSAKELMLNEQGFKAVFGLSYDEFSAWGKWKQSQEKKKHGLF